MSCDVILHSAISYYIMLYRGLPAEAALRVEAPSAVQRAMSLDRHMDFLAASEGPRSARRRGRSSSPATTRGIRALSPTRVSRAAGAAQTPPAQFRGEPMAVPPPGGGPRSPPGVVYTTDYSAAPFSPFGGATSSPPPQQVYDVPAPPGDRIASERIQTTYGPSGERVTSISMSSVSSWPPNQGLPVYVPPPMRQMPPAPPDGHWVWIEEEEEEAMQQPPPMCQAPQAPQMQPAMPTTLWSSPPAPAHGSPYSSRAGSLVRGSHSRGSSPSSSVYARPNLQNVQTSYRADRAASPHDARWRAPSPMMEPVAAGSFASQEFLGFFPRGSCGSFAENHGDSPGEMTSE